MKKTIKMALIAAVLMLSTCLKTSAQNNQYYPPRTLVLSNSTPDELAYCYAYFDMNTNIWTSVGWTKIMAYSTSTIKIGIATTPTFFVHAQNAKGDIWGGNNYFCTDNNAFTIPNADKDGCGTKMRFRPYVLNDAGETRESFTH
jgi:uncharacterized membrane protein